ncbi:MAG: hypothetical protein J6W64_01455 [Bacilli bacterium]|nr:hypothetical protein [Bacilli bacterium]
MEDKQLICDLLCKTLQATRGQKDLIDIQYDRGKETATLHYEGRLISVNVACDSGTAMIRDIMKEVD